MTLLRRLAADRRAVAGIETGLAMAFLLIPLLTVMTGTGLAMITQQRLDRALHGSLMTAWGMAGTAATTDVTAAATASYGSTSRPAMTPTAAISCLCIPTLGSRAQGTAVACSGTCSTSGTVLATYVTSTVTASVPPILGMNWSKTAWALSATGTIRVK